MPIHKMLIDGEWTEGTSEKIIDIVNPATGEVFDHVYESSVADTRKAVAAAKKSFYETRDWRDMDSQQRGDVLLKAADLIAANAAELTRLDTEQIGRAHV